MPSTESGPLRVVVTGRDGQVARSLVERAGAAGITVIPVGRPALDLAKPASIGPALRDARPDVIVNAAAYTAVDKAESEPGLALAINAAGAAAVAEVAADLHVPMIQLSTDYVFDGSGGQPYRESEPTGPLGAYGRSKLAGEQAVVEATTDHVILRTAWVTSPFGANFIKTMLRLATARDEVAVVADQHGCPTDALDMADGILLVARNITDRPDDRSLRGVFHLAGVGETTWAAFAEAIFAASAACGGPHARVRPITTADYPTPAHRPQNSRLDCGKLARIHGVALPPWLPSVQRCVERLLQEQQL